MAVHRVCGAVSDPGDNFAPRIFSTACWRAGITDRQTLQRIRRRSREYVDVWSAVESHCMRGGAEVQHLSRLHRLVWGSLGRWGFICRWATHTVSVGEAVQQGLGDCVTATS